MENQVINNFLVVKKETVAEEVSSGGIILNVPSQFDFGEEFSGKNVCTAEILYDNPNIPYLKKGDRICMNPNKGTKAAMNYDEYTVITKDQYIAKIEKDGRYIVPPDAVMIKMKKQDRDALFSKWIVRNDGKKVQLFIQSEPEKHSERRDAIYVGFGEVVQVGANVKGIQEKDIAILDYTVDNFTDNILYFDDDGNKYIVVDGTTTFHTEALVVHATHDVRVYNKGDFDILSPVMGMIRGEELIARCPYVFLEQKSAVVKRESFGIVYSEKEETLTRAVIAASGISTLKYGMQSGDSVIIKEEDIFAVKINDYKVDCILDSDVIGKTKVA